MSLRTDLAALVSWRRKFQNCSLCGENLVLIDPVTKKRNVRQTKPTLGSNPLLLVPETISTCVKSRSKECCLHNRLLSQKSRYRERIFAHARKLTISSGNYKALYVLVYGRVEEENSVLPWLLLERHLQRRLTYVQGVHVLDPTKPLQ